MKKIAILLFALIIASAGFAEEGNKRASLKTVSFKVVDENNEAVVGAEITIEGLDISTYTDFEGNYTIEVPSDASNEIKISFISYRDYKVNLSDIKSDKITLIQE